jgi:uncharacterized membrane protein YedE/YeeE
MKRCVIAFLSGLVFGIGLIVSQMSNPAKVIGFLDITGSWDPSLALVMAGALAVFGTVYWSIRRPGAPLIAERFVAPTETRIDRPLLAGSLMFGVGWGLSGFCPGPAIVSTTFGNPLVWLFVAAMIAGMLLYRFLSGRRVMTNAPRSV